jgi:hypothetical protein
MRARNLCILHVIALGVFGAIGACTGDDITYGPESGPPKTDATIDQTAPDGGDGGSTLGPRLLMTYSATDGELVAFDTQSKQVAGRMSFPGYGAVVHSGADTFLLETSADVVAKLDPASLTSAVASWNVALSDGSGPNADPVGVVEVAANKAYVLRFNRNAIAVIDPSQTSDAGVPTSTIDLSSLVQGADGDGTVDMVGGVYDATRHRVYVVLGNVDLTTVQPPDYALLCVATKMTMTAIDTTTDGLVDLGGSGPGGSVELTGYNPQMGYYGGVQLDVSGDRVLVVSLGCNPSSGDGGIGGIQQRIVEAVDLKTNTPTQLLDANAQDYPNVFRLIDATHAVIQFGDFAPSITTYPWNPTQSTLGTAFATGPDVFDYDPSANRILGPQSTFDADGGAGPVDVISVSYADGTGTVLGQNPFLQSGGYLGNALYVP